jgi:hypothetical protein
MVEYGADADPLEVVADVMGDGAGWGSPAEVRRRR